MILPFTVPLFTFIGIAIAHRHCDLAIFIIAIAHAGLVDGYETSLGGSQVHCSVASSAQEDHVDQVLQSTAMNYVGFM